MERAKSERLVRAAWVVLVLGATACASQAGDGENVGQSGAELTAQCKANVIGVGTLDVETNYLPHVVHCENGGAPLESLKAQAVAARTYLYYKLETSGSISDGQGDQVYSCGSQPDAMDIQAVKDTEGLILRYQNTTVCSFFVAGGAASPPACHGGSASTESDVTYNQGLSGSNIHQTPLGSVSPTNYRNRGCMSQLGSRCLANEGKNFEDILHFYYGADIGIDQATGPCVTAPATPDAGAHKDGAAGKGSGTVGEDGGGGGAVDEGGAPIGSGGGGAAFGDGGDESNAFPGDSGSGGCSAASAPLGAESTAFSIAPLALLGLVLGRRRRARRA